MHFHKWSNWEYIKATDVYGESGRYIAYEELLFMRKCEKCNCPQIKKLKN